MCLELILLQVCVHECVCVPIVGAGRPLHVCPSLSCSTIAGSIVADTYKCLSSIVQGAPAVTALIYVHALLEDLRLEKFTVYLTICV